MSDTKEPEIDFANEEIQLQIAQWLKGKAFPASSPQMQAYNMWLV